MNNKLSIIPQPAHIEYNEGSFRNLNNLVFQADEQFKELTEKMVSQLNELLENNAKIADTDLEDEVSVKIAFNKEISHDEGYAISINKELIRLSSRTIKGAFYGFQTLRQLILTGNQIPCSKIEDYPRFSWRGFMLDDARHFFGIEEVKKLLDVMALFKFNIFHWHLSDDQGWRVESGEFPLLNEISSKRKGTSTGSRKLLADLDDNNENIDGIPVSGLYTKSQIKDMIRHAEERFITIIPEIDVPGHVQAILAAYPELSCTGGPFEVSVKFGVHKDVFCIGKETVYEFSKKIFKEMISLFPSKIIHAGGDEVPVRRYKKCADCQALMKKEGFTDEKQLQPYFTAKIARFLEENDRIMIGWNEILNDDLPQKIISQFWFGDFNTTLEHIRKGRKTVMSDMKCVYLNYPSKLIPISQTYGYEPVPATLEEKFHKSVLGVEACLWSEFVKDIDTLEYQVFPRLIAVAETGWSLKQNKNFDSFKFRIQNSLKIWDKLNVKYAKSENFEIKY